MARDDQRLPAGRRETDSPRAMITGPLVAAIYVAGGMLAVAFVVVLLALMGGSNPALVREAVGRVLTVGVESGGWIVALISALGSAFAVRLRAMLGGMEYHAGQTRSEITADREARAARDAAQAQQIAELGRKFDHALEDMVEGFRVAMMTVATPAVRQVPDEESAADRVRRHRDPTGTVPAAVDEPPPGGPLLKEAAARARANLDSADPPRWDEMLRDPSAVRQGTGGWPIRG